MSADCFRSRNEASPLDSTANLLGYTPWAIDPWAVVPQVRIPNAASGCIALLH